ncbi:MAG TPA: DUF4386 domain-containing protein [Gemmatimonadaceae bacterium]|nr:DUF4386 domain-containing protein [Gemmatimonadaceae bacterium]
MQNPMRIARAAGVFWLMQAAFAPAMIALPKVYVANDAAQTATNIFAHETLYRLGFAGNLVAVATYIVVAALLYALFRPVHKTVAVLATCFSLSGCIILAFSCVLYVGPLLVLTKAPEATLASSQHLALMLMRLYGQGYNTSLVFFGCFLLMLGYLVFKSGFLPRALGVAVVIAGLGGVAFLWPPFAVANIRYIMLSWIGEGAFALWLLAFGVNSTRWHERSHAHAPSTILQIPQPGLQL